MLPLSPPPPPSTPSPTPRLYIMRIHPAIRHTMNYGGGDTWLVPNQAISISCKLHNMLWTPSVR